LELVDGSLRELLNFAQTDIKVANLLAGLRSTSSHCERAALWEGLSTTLSSRTSIDLSHALAVSLNARLLRSGSGPEFDKLLVLLQERWDSLEAAFGLTIGLREFAFISSKDATIAAAVRDFLSMTLPATAISHVTINAAVATLLWPRETEIRQRVLRPFHPYRQARTTDPGLVRHLLLTGPIPTVDVVNANREKQLQTAFEAHGVCRLRAAASAAADLRHTLVRLAATPVDVGFLQFFPVIDRIDRVEGKMVATLALREHV
jgi:hypothetical protein